jgi:hypothetical protein
MQTESRMVVARGWGRGTGQKEGVFTGYRVLIWQDRILEISYMTM